MRCPTITSCRLLALIFVAGSSAICGAIRVPRDYPRIQLAIDAARSGDSVLVSAGVFHENINFRGRSIALIGVGPDSVIIDGGQPTNPDSASTITFAGGEDVGTLLDGFTIRGGLGTKTEIGNRGGGIYCDNARPVIRNCTIKGNTAGCGGGVGFWRTGGQVKDLPSLSYCLITGNNATETYGGGVWSGYPVIEIDHCTIVSNRSAQGSNLTFSSFAGPSTVKNSILWDGSIGGAAVLSNFSYCDIQGGRPGASNLSLDPLFCNAPAGDYRVAPQSPCIGADSNKGIIGALGIGTPWTSVEMPGASDFPLTFELMAFPNPFNPGTTLTYRLPIGGNVRLGVYDLLGCEVALLHDGFAGAGTHSVRFDRSELSSGVYFCVLRTGARQIVRRLLILK